MDLYLYNTVDSINTMNKTLKDEKHYDITFKESTNISNPMILLKTKDVILYNYAYIPILNRYYFIREIIVNNNNIVKLELECDVLESFRDDILLSDSQIVQSEGNGFYDGDYLQEVRREHIKYESDIELETDETIILSMFRIQE